MASDFSIPSWFALIGGVAMISFGAVSAWKGVQEALLARRATAWTRVPARIEHSEVRQKIGIRGRRFYRVEVGYSYKVAGIGYRGNVINPMYSTSGSRREAEDLQAQLQSGTAVQISCDPNQPEDSMIVAGFLNSGTSALTSGGLILLFGFFLVAIAAQSYFGRWELMARIVHL